MQKRLQVALLQVLFCFLVREDTCNGCLHDCAKTSSSLIKSFSSRWQFAAGRTEPHFICELSTCSRGCRNLLTSTDFFCMHSCKWMADQWFSSCMNKVGKGYSTLKRTISFTNRHLFSVLYWNRIIVFFLFSLLSYLSFIIWGCILFHVVLGSSFIVQRKKKKIVLFYSLFLLLFFSH